MAASNVNWARVRAELARRQASAPAGQQRFLLAVAVALVELRERGR